MQDNRFEVVLINDEGAFDAKEAATCLDTCILDFHNCGGTDSCGLDFGGCGGGTDSCGIDY